MTDDKKCSREYEDFLRERFMSAQDGQGMSDADLLALLLSFTNCRGRVATVRDNLVERFGSPKRCFMAKYSDLVSVEGMTHHAALLILLTAKSGALRPKKSVVPKNVGEYDKLFQAVMRRSRDEELWAAAIDYDDTLIAIERLAVGTQTRVGISIGDVIAFTAYHNAQRIVIAHSHPDVDTANISSDDINAMEQLEAALNTVGVELVGHVVVAGKDAKFYEYTK